MKRFDVTLLVDDDGVSVEDLTDSITRALAGERLDDKRSRSIGIIDDVESITYVGEVND